MRYLFPIGVKMPRRSLPLVSPLALVISLITVANAADYVVCESDQDRRRYCNIRSAQDVDIEISRQLSKSACSEGYSWGRDDRGIWVDNGCRAEFAIHRRHGGSYGDPYHDDFRERDRLEREEERLREERREIERERERLHQESARATEERCPPGFVPGNHRCSDDERRRGCKDMRMPGGTTCNSRGWSK